MALLLCRKSVPYNMMLKFLPVYLLLQILCMSSRSLGRDWSQKPFEQPIKDIPDADSYNFKWPVRKVAIIGAGPRWDVNWLHYDLNVPRH